MILYDKLDLVIRKVELPETVHGAITMDEDGRANIYINASDPEERQLKALRHELIHFFLGHPDMKDRDPADLEAEASRCSLDIIGRKVTDP